MACRTTFIIIIMMTTQNCVVAKNRPATRNIMRLTAATRLVRMEWNEFVRAGMCPAARDLLQRTIQTFLEMEFNPFSLDESRPYTMLLIS